MFDRALHTPLIPSQDSASCFKTQAKFKSDCELRFKSLI